MKKIKKSWPYILDLIFVSLFCFSVIALIYTYVGNEFETFVKMGSEQNKQLSKACLHHKVTRVKIGAVVYELPTDKIFYSEYGSSSTPVCFNGASFSLVYFLMPFSYQNGAKTVSTNVRLFIYQVPPPHRAEDTYSKYIHEGKTVRRHGAWENAVPIEEMSEGTDFIIRRLSKHDGLLVVRDPKIKTPQGNPVAFYCNFRDGVINDYNCNLSVALSDDRLLGITEINAKEIPKEKLMNLYESALAEEAKRVAPVTNDK